MTREIESKKIVETAMGLVTSAKQNVQMTMQAKEEMTSPLPSQYFLLLKSKMDEGIHIERTGFGSEEEFEQLGEQVLFAHQNYSFRCVDDANYKRMLLIDGSKLMFAKSDESGRHVYYTEDPEAVSEYKEYFSSLK
jgi:hypothetical protein